MSATDFLKTAKSPAATKTLAATKTPAATINLAATQSPAAARCSEISSAAIKISAAIKSLSATKASAKSMSKEKRGFSFRKLAKLPEPCSSDEFSEYDISSQAILNMTGATVQCSSNSCVMDDFSDYDVRSQEIEDILRKDLDCTIESIKETANPKLSAPGMSQTLPRKINLSTRKKKKEIVTIVLSDCSNSPLSSPKANENIRSNSAKNNDDEEVESTTVIKSEIIKSPAVTKSPTAANCSTAMSLTAPKSMIAPMSPSSKALDEGSDKVLSQAFNTALSHQAQEAQEVTNMQSQQATSQMSSCSEYSWDATQFSPQQESPDISQKDPIGTSGLQLLNQYESQESGMIHPSIPQIHTTSDPSFCTQPQQESPDSYQKDLIGTSGLQLLNQYESQESGMIHPSIPQIQTTSDPSFCTQPFSPTVDVISELVAAVIKSPVISKSPGVTKSPTAAIYFTAANSPAMCPAEKSPMVMDVPDTSSTESLLTIENSNVANESLVQDELNQIIDCLQLEPMDKINDQIDQVAGSFRPAKSTSMHQMWDNIALKHYESVKTSVSKILPLDMQILNNVKSLSYTSALGHPVDFAYNLSQYWRTNQSNLLTDNKKKASLVVRTNYVMNNVGRYYTFAVGNFNIPRDDPRLLYSSIRNLQIITKFLMTLIDEGRKKDSIWTNILSLRKFDIFLTQMKLLEKSNEFEDIVTEVKALIYPVVQFQSCRLAAERSNKAEQIANFSPQDYSILVSGDELDQISSMIANKNLAEIEDWKPVMAMVIGLSFLLWVFFNSSRTSDATTVTVTAIRRAIEMHRSNKSDEEFLMIRGLLQTKESHRNMTKKKEISTLRTAPLVIWPIHKIFFLENVLGIIKKVKTSLKAKGQRVDNDWFFINENGLACSSKELSAYRRIACQVMGVPELKTRFWRSLVETLAKERQMENCLKSPESSFSQHQMEAVSQHQNHTDLVAEKSYRMKTSNRSQIVGHFVSSLAMEGSRKRKTSSDLPNSPKREKLNKPFDSLSKEIVERASRYMFSSHDRKSMDFELKLQSACKELDVQYSPPWESETKKERDSRRKRIRRLINIARKNSKCSSESSESETAISKISTILLPCSDSEPAKSGLSSVSSKDICPEAVADALDNFDMDLFDIDNYDLSFFTDSNEVLRRDVEAEQQKGVDDFGEKLNYELPSGEKALKRKHSAEFPNVQMLDISSHLNKRTSGDADSADSASSGQQLPTRREIKRAKRPHSGSKKKCSEVKSKTSSANVK